MSALSAPNDSSADSNHRRLTATSGGRRRTGGKRGNAEGSVWQRKDGRWVAAFHDGAGRRVQRYARTRADAAAKLAEGLKLQVDRVIVPAEKQTVGEYLAEWLESSARRTVRPMTFVSYESIVRQHLIPDLGSTPLTKLSPQQIQRLLNAKSDAGLSPRRVAYIKAVLRRALREALEWGLVSRNAAALVRSPRAERYEVRPLEPEQARRFLDEVRGDRLEALYSVALAVGLRAGEALGLCWDDVDLDAGELHVRHGLQKIAGEWRLVEPKTSRSRRTVSLPGVTVEALRAHRERQAAERERAGDIWADQWGLVFTRRSARPSTTPT